MYFLLMAALINIEDVFLGLGFEDKFFLDFLNVFLIFCIFFYSKLSYLYFFCILEKNRLDFFC